MNMILMDSPAASDEQLWQLSRAGDREAFGRIVERYQSLICSLAFSACGSLASSEDLAQETDLLLGHEHWAGAGAQPGGQALPGFTLPNNSYATSSCLMSSYPMALASFRSRRNR